MNIELSRLSGVVSSFKLYKLFGYTEHRGFKKVIYESIDSLRKLGEVNVITKDPSSNGGRPTMGYLLNIDQLFFITAVSKNGNSGIKNKIVTELVKAYSHSTSIAIANVIDGMDVADLPADRFVYVAKEVVSGRFKIGISRDPERRVKELNVGNPEKLIIVHAYLAIESGHKSEAIAHALFESERLHGEWFGESTDISLLPSFSSLHEDSADCNCYECSAYNDSLHVVDDKMTRDAAIKAIVNGTNNTIETAIYHVDAMLDTGYLN